MSKENPNTYTAEFRASAVKLANESDKPISQVAQELGINVILITTVHRGFPTTAGLWAQNGVSP